MHILGNYLTKHRTKLILNIWLYTIISLNVFYFKNTYIHGDSNVRDVNTIGPMKAQVNLVLLFVS